MDRDLPEGEPSLDTDWEFPKRVSPRWLAAWRDDDWALETPTTVAELLRQNPISPLLWFGCIAWLCVGVVASELDLPAAVEAPLGVLVAATIWWPIMFAFARGWIGDDA